MGGLSWSNLARAVAAAPTDAPAAAAAATATAAAATATTAAVRGVQPDDVLWYSLCLEHDNTWVHRSPSASAGATEDGLGAVLLRRGLHMRTLQSEREYLR